MSSSTRSTSRMQWPAPLWTNSQWLFRPATLLARANLFSGRFLSGAALFCALFASLQPPAAAPLPPLLPPPNGPPACLEVHLPTPPATKTPPSVPGGPYTDTTGHENTFQNCAGLEQSSRRKTKDFRSFPPISFVFRPLTPPYVPFGIRRFLTFCAIEHSNPSGRDNLLCEGLGLRPLVPLSDFQLPTSTLCWHYPTCVPSTA